MEQDINQPTNHQTNLRVRSHSPIDRVGHGRHMIRGVHLLALRPLGHHPGSVLHAHLEEVGQLPEGVNLCYI